MRNGSAGGTIGDVIYLASCAVRGITPDKNRVMQMNLRQVYLEASRQLIAGCCAFALESVGMCTDDFVQAKAEAIRRVVLMDVQRNAILAELEKEGIWYLPLKGCLLKDVYPSLGMREMADNDILFDANRIDDVRRIMQDDGFKLISSEKGAHDIFYKAPIFNFEMHRMLFAVEHGVHLSTYYDDVRNRLISDGDGRYGLRFSPEDFYLYMVAHEYKHYCHSGIGVRGCLDTFVYLTRTMLDMDYVQAEAEKMGIAEFEKCNRTLALHLMGDHDLTLDELEMLDYMIRAGMYGNIETLVEHGVAKYGGGAIGKIRYVLRRAIIPMEAIKADYPFFYNHRLLLPLVAFVRISKMLTTSRKRVMRELRALRKAGG